ncbi:MAG: oligosaccharide flippase family protein [Patescibacteria group bacterium]
MRLKQQIIGILRWIEKYSKTDMVYLASGGFWLALGKIIFNVSGFLLVIAFANFLPKQVYGTYQYVLSVAGILAIPTLSGMNTAIVRSVARGYEGSLLPALKTQLRWGVLGGIAGLIIAGYYFLNNNIALTTSFLIVAVFVPLMNSFMIYEAFWIGKKRFDIQVKYSAIIRIVSTIALIASLLLTKNLIFIFLIYFASYTTLYFIFLQITIKKIPPNAKQDPSVISYGKHLSLIDIVAGVASQLDKILIWYFLGAESLAIYFFAVSPVQQVRAFFKALRPLTLAKLSQYNNEKSKVTLLKKIVKLFPVIALIIVIYIFLAPYAYQVFFPQYMKSVLYSQLYALSLLSVPQILFIIFLTSQKKTKELYIFYSIFYFTQILLLAILLPLYGMLGAVIALTATQFLNFGILLFLFKKAKIIGL